MRRLLLIPALIALAVPAFAGAWTNVPGDGALLLKDASGKVVIQARGGVIGRFDQGALIVRDPNPDDEFEAVVTGAETKRLVDDFVTQYSGKNIRFRFMGGRFKITLVKTTTGLDLSAIGKGTVWLQGAGTLDDGEYSFNGDKPKPLPLFYSEFALSAQTPTTQ